MRVAAIDCGTNSIRLLVADLTTTARGVSLVDVHREMRIVRLGEGVDRTGLIQPGALDRTWAALSDYTAILRSSGAVRVRMAATSATRDASNRQLFVDMVTSTLGQPPEVITGEVEAELSFRGAVGDLDPSSGPFLVADIGGGSTEIVVGTAAQDGSVTLDGAASVDLGSVRLTERLLHGDPPTAAEIVAARRLITAELSAALDRLPVRTVRTVVAVSGTATTVAAAAMRLPSYDPTLIHLATVTTEQVHDAATFFLGATTAHRGALGYMYPGRVDVIGAGALLFDVLVRQLVRRVPLERITVSEHDILDGLALSLAL
ncbi:MAG: Ppx/GppA phosphatase family protein [Nakamurella sp.]